VTRQRVNQLKIAGWIIGGLCTLLITISSSFSAYILMTQKEYREETRNMVKKQEIIHKTDHDHILENYLKSETHFEAMSRIDNRFFHINKRFDTKIQ